MFRFFASYHPQQGWKVPAAEVRHMSKVLRMRAGEEVELCDGRGHVTRLRITHLKNDHVTGEEHSLRRYEPCSPHITLYVTADITSDLGSTLLPSLTELGVSRVRWSVSRSSEKKIPSEAHRQRLQRVAVAAMKQSKTPFLVELEPRLSLAEDLTQQSGICCVLDPDAPSSLVDFLVRGSKKGKAAQQHPWTFYIGGPGGWTEEHIKLLSSFPKAHLGPYVLRVPTALFSVAALARGVLGNSHNDAGLELS